MHIAATGADNVEDESSPVSIRDERKSVHGALRNTSAVRSGAGEMPLARWVRLPHVRTQGTLRCLAWQGEDVPVSRVSTSEHAY
jgi:hypothetical protein